MRRAGRRDRGRPRPRPVRAGRQPGAGHPRQARAARGARASSTCSWPSTSTPPRRPTLATHVLPMADHFERGDLRHRLPAGQAVPALRAGRRGAGRRAPPAVVGVRRAEPAPRPAAVRQRPPRRRAGRAASSTTRSIAESMAWPRPPPVGRGAGRAVRHRRRPAGAGLAGAGTGSRTCSTWPRPSSSPSSPRRPRRAAGDALVMINRRTAGSTTRSPSQPVDARRCSCTPTTPPPRPRRRRRRRRGHGQRLVPRRRRGHRHDPPRRGVDCPTASATPTSTRARRAPRRTCEARCRDVRVRRLVVGPAAQPACDSRALTAGPPRRRSARSSGSSAAGAMPGTAPQVTTSVRPYGR